MKSWSILYRHQKKIFQLNESFLFCGQSNASTFLGNSVDEKKFFKYAMIIQFVPITKISCAAKIKTAS